MNTKELQEDMVADEMIMNRIYVLRGKKVMIDEDLCRLYRVGDTRIKKLVVKHPGCFPADFLFQLNKEDYRSLSKQDSSIKRGAVVEDYPLALTEQGLAMLAGMLKGSRSVMVNIRIIRIFTLIRDILPDYSELSRHLSQYTQNMSLHK